MYKNIQSSQSQIQVFNLASGGATIDATLVPALKPEVLCCLFNLLLSSSNRTIGPSWIKFNSSRPSCHRNQMGFSGMDQIHYLHSGLVLMTL